jgi:hypothetical protein
MYFIYVTINSFLQIFVWILKPAVLYFQYLGNGYNLCVSDQMYLLQE